MKKLQTMTGISLLIILMFQGCALFRGGKEEPEPTVDTGQAVSQQEAAAQPQKTVPPPPTPAVNTPGAVTGSNKDYVINELNFEVKKLGAEVKHLATELRDMQAKSTMWANPLAIYNKEIILDNGSTIYGKIVYQDEKILKVETLIGYLIVERPTVVRIVENIPEQPVIDQLEPAAGSKDMTTPSPAGKLVAPTYISQTPSGMTQPAGKAKFAGNVVLVGTIAEKKDRSGNLIFSGEVKNIGGRRADFVKINFVFRKNWSGDTKTITTFIQGSFHSFESGITSDSSLLPGASGSFELYVPRSFGTFIGYSYTIDWEEY